MAEFADQMKSLDEKLTKTLEAATSAQKSNEELKGRADSVDSTVKKAAEEATKAMEEAQTLRLKVESVEKTAQYIEKAISRMPGATDSERNEMEEKAGDQTARYLRTGIKMDGDVSENIIRALTEKTFYGVDDSRKEAEVKTLIAGSQVDGGYWIRPERAAKMIKRIFETSPVRTFADVMTTSGDVLEFLIDDDEAESGGWVGETENRPETGTPKIGLVSIPVHEQYAEPKATQKMLDDAGFDIESWVQGKATRKMSRIENTAFVLGDGSQKPRGILDYPAWAAAGVYERKKLERINSTINGEFDADSIKLLQNSLIEEYQASAIFALRRSSFTNIITLKDDENNYLLDPRSMKVGDTLVLLGKQVVFMNDIPAAATDSLSMIYGDWGVGYTVVDRIGFRVIRDNVTQKPFILFYTTKRTGGDVTNYEALKIYKLAT